MNETSPTPLDASLIEAWNAPEKLPEIRQWLKEGRNEVAQAQYAFIIIKKYFVCTGLDLYVPPTFNFSSSYTSYALSPNVARLFIEI